MFGAFKLAIELVGNIKAKTGALALANEQMEFFRSLPYDAVGTVGGIPSGAIAQTEDIVLNNKTYTRRTFIQYVDDPADGEGIDDETGVTADYKRAKVEMTWDVRGETRSLSLVSNIVPRGVESLSGGGTLSITVIDALGVPVPSAEVTIQNGGTSPAVDVTTFTNASGKIIFPGAPASTGYSITVTKSGFSAAQTYDATGGNPNPNPGHLTVLDGETTSATFAIDLLGSKTVLTREPPEDVVFLDEFDTDTFISSATNVAVTGGDVRLVAGNTTGSFSSTPVTSAYLNGWEQFMWEDTIVPDTEVVYHVRYDSGDGTYVPIPDTDLPGNAVGFTTSPVNLSSLPIATYGSLQLVGILTTEDASTTPQVEMWSVAYTEGAEPIPDIPFTMRGTKTIGTDGGGLPIYKYDASLSTNGSGELTIPNLEWDTYTIIIDSGTTGYDIAEACMPQPFSLAPGTAATTTFFLVPDTAHSLLVFVSDDNGVPIADASVNLTRSGFDEIQATSVCGQTFFGGLGSSQVGGQYALDVSAAGYQDATITNVDVVDASQITVVLMP
jgi:hypothetical protein